MRGFYGAYYQAPPLSTVSGSLLNFAATQGLGIIPLKGERDEEYQIGLTIPLAGWSADINTFRQRATNYFDHNSIGNSNVFFPLSIAGARISGWEFSIRSPRLFRRGEVNIAYSYQHVEGQGAITGGLTDFSPPEAGYYLLDHDQRHTLHGNFNFTLPLRAWVAGGVYYGSGFTDGDNPTVHLQPHTTVDFSSGEGDRRELVRFSGRPERCEPTLSAGQQRDVRRNALWRSEAGLRAASIPVSFLMRTRACDGSRTITPFRGQQPGGTADHFVLSSLLTFGCCV